MQTHTLRANIHVAGSVYRKHGTTFETRTLVIDAAGPQRDRETITAEVESVAELVKVLEPVRATRRPAMGKLPTTAELETILEFLNCSSAVLEAQAGDDDDSAGDDDDSGS